MKMSRMSIKDIYSQEKKCSKICNEVYQKIKNLLISPKKYLKLPKIGKSGVNHKRASTILKLKSEKKIDYSNCSISSTKVSKSISSISCRKKNNDYNINSMNKDNNDCNNDKIRKSQICRKMLGMFNNRNNFSIIKGGGIKYNNSIFRIKNINHLL